MRWNKLTSTSPRFLTQVVVPVLGIVGATCIAVFALMHWSSSKTDQIAVERQERLLALVLSQAQYNLAHDQESATVWDDAVRMVKARNTDWLDSNLGSWMNTYFGHDAAYVLNPKNDAVFTSENGAIAELPAYEAVKPSVEPLIARLRELMRNPDANALGARVLSPGASEILILGGRPAIVSVKPIVSDTGKIEQNADETFLHVALRYLDRSFVTELQRDYMFQGLRYASRSESQFNEYSFDLKSSLGQTIGYLIWKPYLPGTAAMSQLTPALLALTLVMCGIVTALLAGLRVRSQRLRMSEERLGFLATHDSLTGLPNRNYFNDHLDSALSEVRNACVAVLYLDLDRFKQVNDTLGHPIGDALIRDLTGRLKSAVSDVDAVARIGGDEFTVILPNFGSQSDIAVICDRIIAAVADPFEIDGNHIFVGISIGVAIAPSDGVGRDELVRKADIALYHAKAAGGGRFAVFGKEMDAMLQERRTLERELRQALDSSGEIFVHYQPLYSAAKRTITGVEALVRWQHPTRGLIAPDVFIPVAEEAGLIEALGERVLRQACWESRHWPIETVAVNVSAVELRNPGYAAKVTSLLLALGVAPERLELEVTESALTDNAGHCELNIKALRANGVTIALDDFGTGFSSLGRLQQLEVDRIKIDRSFVQGFGRSKNDEHIVRAIVELAHAKGLRTTAEGVETEEQSSYLLDIGCDDLQGYLLSRPVTASQIERLLQADVALRE